MANGLLLYSGPGELDGAPIVVIATGLKSASANSKTGAMIQTYILRADVAPTDAIRSGEDSSICGACPHRGAGDGSGRTCYVNVGQGPLSVFRAYQRGVYPRVTDWSVFSHRVIRFGTYGDPAAAPVRIWKYLAALAKGRTGYTHQWRTRPDLRDYCMASVDTEAEALEARAAGWRYFRVALPGAAARLESEAICPASAESGKKLTCSTCLACSGGGRRGSIVIQVHGDTVVMANVRRRVA
jgi:hypothetical protein